MKAVVINQYGSKEVLEEAEVTLPELSEHQVLVKEYATSINPIDWKLREGYLKQMFDWSFPIILGWDVADAAKLREIPLPIPLPPPVTKTTLPFNCKSMILTS